MWIRVHQGTTTTNLKPSGRKALARNNILDGMTLKWIKRTSGQRRGEGGAAELHEYSWLLIISSLLLLLESGYEIWIPLGIILENECTEQLFLFCLGNSQKVPEQGLSEDMAFNPRRIMRTQKEKQQHQRRRPIHRKSFPLLPISSSCYWPRIVVYKSQADKRGRSRDSWTERERL